MSIKAVFWVQCDGPCRGWLSRTGDYVSGPRELPHHNEVLPTAERAWLWPGERAARTSAQASGWYVSSVKGGVRALCPECKRNPLGIVLPKQCIDCGHVHRSPICRVQLSHMTICACLNERAT